MSGFEDVVDVPALLTPSEIHDEVMDKQIEQIGGWLGSIDDAWQWLFGYSLLGRVFTPLTGDWASLDATAEGWDKLAEAAAGLDRNVSSFADNLGETWKGESYEKFQGHISLWSESFLDEQEMAKDIAKCVRDLADNARVLFEVIVTAINLIVDIILFALKAVSLAKAIKRAAKALEKARKIEKVIEKFKTLIESLIEFIDAYIRLWKEVGDNLPMPSGEVAVPDEGERIGHKPSERAGGRRP